MNLAMSSNINSATLVDSAAMIRYVLQYFHTNCFAIPNN